MPRRDFITVYVYVLSFTIGLLQVLFAFLVAQAIVRVHRQASLIDKALITDAESMVHQSELFLLYCAIALGVTHFLRRILVDMIER